MEVLSKFSGETDKHAIATDKSMFSENALTMPLVVDCIIEMFNISRLFSMFDRRGLPIQMHWQRKKYINVMSNDKLL